MESFEWGYSKALIDVKNWLRANAPCLRSNRLYNEEGIDMVMHTLIANREIMKDYGDVKLRFNKEKKEFELK